MAKDDKDFYGYDPSLAAAIVTIIIFAILTTLHLILLFKTRTWFCIPFTIGALFEVIGFITRALGHTNRYYIASKPGPLVYFIIQAVLILLAPLFFAASVYMFLSRIIRATGHTSYSPVCTKWLTKIFVGGDFLCLNIQSTGASMLTNAKGNAKKADLGTNIVMTGLVLQIVIFAFFVGVAGVWHRRMRSGPGAPGKHPVGANGWDWERYMWMLYVASGIITARNLYRVVEYAMGEDGYLLMNEWSVYVLDALPMVVVLVVCARWYVGDLSGLLRERGEEVEMMVDGERRGTVRSE
ncbi:RTA1 like protein [Lentithecium fluviatile CBS 122367]|uniref:RTA1 like protein n=1 Tax=Lentithecium fluviatile CBS 122367 TaxID=1168545 RepID=A0A6G1IIN6_9PLEO|nr:RTA1 like protein [Lentithecium fluviatile CBS 122367]